MGKKVCIFGSNRELGKARKEEFTRLGRLLAEKGFIVVSGGFGGAMEDVSKGAKSAGGETIGVTFYRKQDLPGKGSNPYIDQEIKEKDIFSRITKMMKISDAFVILPGGTGTLLELAAVLEHINKDLSKPKPVILLGDFWKGVIDNIKDEPILSERAKITLSALSCADLVAFVNTAEEIITKLESI